MESLKLELGQRVVTLLTQIVSLKSPSLSVSRILICKSLPTGMVVELTDFKVSCGLLWKVSLPQETMNRTLRSKMTGNILFIYAD
jgi:hypothetical protein